MPYTSFYTSIINYLIHGIILSTVLLTDGTVLPFRLCLVDCHTMACCFSPFTQPPVITQSQVNCGNILLLATWSKSPVSYRLSYYGSLRATTPLVVDTRFTQKEMLTRPVLFWESPIDTAQEDISEHSPFASHSTTTSAASLPTLWQAGCAAEGDPLRTTGSLLRDPRKVRKIVVVG